MSPRYQAPRHLARLTERIELAIAGHPQRVVCHAPPRFAKSETVLHSISYGLRLNARLRFGYGSYNSEIALSQSRRARDLAAGPARVSLVRNSLREWRTPEGGGCFATGVGGGLTGRGIDVMFVDDSVKDRVEAESPLRRQRIYEWEKDVVTTRIEPGGSIFVFQTRWHPDDLPGRLIKEGWEYICLPAITRNAQGEELSLWPERWPLEMMKERRKEVGAYTWESLYQGSPRPRGGAVFGEPSGYVQLPRLFRVAIGVDLAYAAQTSSDWSVLVVLYEGLESSGKRTGQYYVADVVRVQQRAPQFLEICKLYRKQYPTAGWRWYASGTEKGAADFMRPAIPLQVIQPRGDKFTRAMAYAAAWNARKVAAPGGSSWREGRDPNTGEPYEVEGTREPPPDWVHPFLSEHSDFTGVNDDHDDCVDAAVAAYDLLTQGANSGFGDSVVQGPQRRTL